MANALDDSNIVVDRDYTDNFAIKETAINTLGNKYFGDLDLAAYNVGELGFVLEQIANITEDAFNTASILMHESFPNKACIPESIYSHAAIFQIDSAFTKCATCSFMMILLQDEILNKGTKNGTRTSFFIDKNTIIYVEDIPFTLDYDIKIQADETSLDGSIIHNFSAQYNIDYNNSISSVNDPYLKIRKLPNGYLLLNFTAKQVERNELTDNVISNTKINYPVITFNFEGNLAGFDIFYKAPGSLAETQLTKLIKFSMPIKSPFCFYRLKNENTLELTFSSRDGYFQPEFNSEIRVVMYTTLGAKGNFDCYTGTKITFQTSSEKYAYNDSVTFACKTTSDSIGGSNPMTLEELQALTVESYSNATEISTENDIMTYFYNYKYRYGNEILVVKRRDDVTERLFSAFLILKNNDFIYPTNTLHANLIDSDFDTSEGNNRYTLDPGHIFVYEAKSTRTVKMIQDVMCYDTEKVAELMTQYDFVYTNPFLISVTRSPNLVGLYKTITNQVASLDYVSANDTAFMQFITSSLTIDRDLSPDRSYELTAVVAPSSSLEKYVFTLNDYKGTIHYYFFTDDVDTDSTKFYLWNENESTARYYESLSDESATDEITYSELEELLANDTIYEDTDMTEVDKKNQVRVIAGLVGSDGNEVGYIELYPRMYHPSDESTVSFSAKLETNDFITSTGQLDILNAVKVDELATNVYVPISNAIINIYVLFDDAITESNRLGKYFDDLDYYCTTNIYSTKSDPVTFINPLNMMRSTVSFNNTGTKDIPAITTNLTMLPMVKADIINNDESFNTFINRVTSNYNYLEECLPILRNNTHIDIKFYNTYGKSNNYHVGDDEELIDRVDISIRFKITTNDNNADNGDMISSIKDFIKSFIESINSSGTNDLFISNLIRELESNFAQIHHLKFLGINNYTTDYQTISVNQTDLNNLTKDERRNYVPEILVIDRDNIELTISNN